MIICEETDEDGAYRLAEKIREAVEAYEFKSVGKKTVSSGVAQMQENTSVNDLIQRADEDLYEAKDGGRNRSVVYKKGDN